MSSKYSIGKRLFYKFLFVATLLLIWLSLGGVSKVGALSGDSTNILPHDPNAWLIVTRPGGNGMDAISMSGFAYVPVSAGASFSLTIQSACDNGVEDDDPNGRNTVFSMPNTDVSSVSLSSGTATIIAAPHFFSPVDHWILCNSGSDVTVNVTIAGSAPTIDINGITYRRIRISATVSTASLPYYANRFRFVSGTAGVLFGFENQTTRPASSNGYTGIAYGNVSSGWGWSTTVNFAEPCNAPAGGTSRQVWFWDNDHNPDDENINPLWQTLNHPMTYEVRAYNRANDAFIGIAAQGTFIGGNNVTDQTDVFTTYPNQKYQIRINNINYVNSIQVALPLPQINANERCPTPGCTDPAAINYNSAANVDDGSCQYDVCLNIAGNQVGTPPPGYVQSGTNCLFPTPNCVVTNVVIGIGRSFTMSARATNNATIALDTISMSYGVAVSGIPGNDSANIGASTFRDFTSSAHSFSTRPTRTITWTLAYRTLYGNQSITCSGTVTITVAVLTCSTPPFNITTGDTFAPRVTINNPNGVPAQISSATYSITGASGPYSGSVSPPIANVTQDGSATYNGALVTINTPGLYTLDYSVVWTIDGSGSTVDCTDTDDGSIVSNKPYARFYGNDVIACGSIASNPLYSVRFSGGYNGAPGPGTYRGAASQLAIFASQQINGLMSGSQYQTPPGRASPWDLSFANTANTFLPGLDFGGSIGDCPDTAVPATPSALPNNINGGNINPAVSGAYSFDSASGPLRGQIADGERIVVYASGQVVIGNGAGGITYNSTGPWGDTDSIPSFTLVVDGDIFIDYRITQLDGHYIATGDIFTCSFGSGSNLDVSGADSGTPAQRAFVVSNCANKLVVNGSFKASRVHFLRSNGTVSTGTPFEAHGSANIAEVFRFSPEAYLASGLAAGLNSGGVSKYDSIVSRPPSY